MGISKNYKKPAIWIMIGAVIGLLLFLMPYSFSPFSLCIDKFSFIGNGTLKYSVCKASIASFMESFNLSTYLTDVSLLIFTYIMQFSPMVYMIIMIALFAMGLILLLTGDKFRKVLRILSIIAGVILIFLFVTYLAFTIGTIINAVKSSIELDKPIKFAMVNGNFVLFGLAGIFFTLILAIKCFKWFYKA